MKRVRRNVESKSKSVTPARAPRFSLFGQPLLLDGEDADAYDHLLTRICAAIKPVDIIDEMLIIDVISLEWEVLRWRRLKWNLIRAHGLEALKQFLNENLGYDSYTEHFEARLVEILEDNLPEGQAPSAQMLARGLFGMKRALATIRSISFWLTSTLTRMIF